MQILLSFAHPDDESFSSGGTIAQLAKAGADIVLLSATRGEAGELGIPPLTTKEALPQIREQELRNASKILGISDIHFLGFLDGTLHTFPIKKLAESVYSYMKEEKPDIVITFNREGGSKHPDHVQISKATTLAFQAYAKKIKKHVCLYYTATPRHFLQKLYKEGIQYTGFGKAKGIPKSQITTAIDITHTLDIKLAALHCHKTQHKDVERFMKRQKFEEFHYEFFKLAYENSML